MTKLGFGFRSRQGASRHPGTGTRLGAILPVFAHVGLSVRGGNERRSLQAISPQITTNALDRACWTSSVSHSLVGIGKWACGHGSNLVILVIDAKMDRTPRRNAQVSYVEVEQKGKSSPEEV